MKIAPFALLGASSLLLSTPLAAAGNQLQTCGSDTIPLQTTNWSATATVPKFDPSLGVLLQIEFELKGDIQGSAAIESLDAAPSVVTTNYQAGVTLTRPDTSVIVVTLPRQVLVDNLTAFDGTIDFAGTSGITHGNLSTNTTSTAISTAPADLALFTGPAGNPGTIDLTVDAIGTSNANGSGNIITQFMTQAGAEVRVCYVYGLDCNGNGIDDAVDTTQGGGSNDINLDGIPDECQPGITVFCTGDGSQNGGTDCPCGNNGGPGEGCDNGSGTGGLLTATGTPSIANDTLVLTASQIPGNSPGFFFYGNDLANGGDGVPFYEGLLCLTNPIGIRKVDFGGSIPQGTMPPLSIFINASAGDTTYFQYWYRNPGGLCQAGGANTTNGLQVTWGF